MDPTADTDAHTENETPPPTTNDKLPNGALKRHLPHHHHRRHQPPDAVSAYKECLKNHAACMGGHAVDGCGEFMPSPTADPTVPTSLKCDACGCHRNFHRRVVGDPTTHFLDFHPPPAQQLPPPPRRSSPLSSSPSPPPPQTAYYYSAPHMLLALSTAVQDDQPPTVNHHAVVTTQAENPTGRKRFRTKFSQEQKEKMLSISEKLGWKIQKCDEGLVEEFCNEVGVGKGVLKVWMHNNKHTFGKKDLNSAVVNNNSKSTNGRVLNTTTTDNGHLQNESNNGVHLHGSPNGSPSA